MLMSINSNHIYQRITFYIQSESYVFFSELRATYFMCVQGVIFFIFEARAKYFMCKEGVTYFMFE